MAMMHDGGQYIFVSIIEGSAKEPRIAEGRRLVGVVKCSACDGGSFVKGDSVLFPCHLLSVLLSLVSVSMWL